MRIRRHSLVALAAATALAAPLAGSATGTPAGAVAPDQGQQAQLDRACHETVAGVQAAVENAPNGQVQAIRSHLRVLSPGVVTGQITFNTSGKQVTVGARADTAAMSFGCGEGTAPLAGIAGAAAGSRVVSTLHRTFTRPGRYELTFTLNRAGRNMLARLAADDDAYFKQNPQGKHPPTLAFGVALSYSPTG